MSYSFRIRFSLPKTLKIGIDSNEWLISDAGTSHIIIIRSQKKDFLIKDSDDLVVIGNGYATQDEAITAGKQFQDIFIVAFSHNHIGVDFGNRSPKGCLTREGLLMIQEQSGKRILNDFYGILAYETEPTPFFANTQINVVITKSQDNIKKDVRQLCAINPTLTDKERLVYDLFSASFFQQSVDARFLMLMMALETLIDQNNRSDEIKEHIKMLINETLSSSIPQNEKASIIKSLGWLKIESIGQAGRRLVRSLGDRKYNEKTPENFFTECYDLRSELVHGKIPRPSREKVDCFAVTLEGFDKEKYMNALEECNVYNKETILRYLDFFSGLINMVGDSALQTIKQKKQEEEKADLVAELLIANKELVFKNEEKEKQTATLTIANLSLLKSETRYKALTETSMDGYFVADIEGRFLEVNGAYCKISGYSKEALLSMNISDLEHDESKEQTAAHIKKIIIQGRDLFESRHRRADGSIFNVYNNITFIPKEKLFICFVNDITENKKKEDEIIHLLNSDQLTGLYNRRFYEEELMRLDTKRNLPLTIVMGDVNGLKLINDSFGHAMGDELLKKTAEVIKNGCRAGDIVARLGGDEFVILLPQTDALETEKIVERIKDLSSKEKVNSLEVSISFGYETKTTEDENIQEVFKKAEDRMYRNKRSESSDIRSKTVGLVMNTLYKKSSREQLHSIKVSKICEDIATRMDLSKNDIYQIKIAGLMHDIGKIEIDENILNKPAKLTNEEWEKMQRHPEIGYRILSSVNEFTIIADDVLEHHERWDGKGYPKGLKGDASSLHARIITIADAYDAMTSDRIYGTAISEEDAIQEIERCSGTQFDPAIAKVFIEKVLGKERQ